MERFKLKIKPMFSKFYSFFKKTETSKTEGITPETGYFISIWTAGIKYENRLENILQCKLQEKVSLVREPENISDTNAIHVKTKGKKSLGFISKNLAKILAPEMDRGVIKDCAYIINIKTDLRNDYYGVKIALPVTAEIYEKQMNVVEDHEIDYEFDLSLSNNLYLLVNCDELQLKEIYTVLGNSGISILRTGISVSPSSSGKIYKWFLRLEENSDQDEITRILRNKFPVIEERYDQEITTEYIELQDRELEKLKSDSEKLLKQNKKLEKDLENLKNVNVSAYVHFDKMLDIFLPSVFFLRDSKDVLFRETQDYKIALCKIYEIVIDPHKRVKKVKTLEKWCEFHYSTGQKDDGRIYYRRNNNEIEVLVSFKKTQTKDILYLRGI